MSNKSDTAEKAGSENTFLVKTHSAEAFISATVLLFDGIIIKKQRSVNY